MKIGIIIYSKTGNTLSVAEKLKESLIASGKEAELIALEVVGKENVDYKLIELNFLPDLNTYDGLVFASPVHAFSLSMPMRAYLTRIKELNGKKVYLYVTQQLKKAWLGGNRTVKAMKGLVEGKNGNVVGSSIVNWSNPDRDNMIADTVSKVTQAF